MPHRETPTEYTFDTTGTLVDGDNNNRRFVEVFNRDTGAGVLRVYVLDPGETTPADATARYVTIAGGNAWYRDPDNCPSNPIFVRADSGTVVGVVSVQNTTA